MFQRQMTLATAHVDNELLLYHTSSLRRTIFSKTEYNVTGLGSIKTVV